MLKYLWAFLLSGSAWAAAPILDINYLLNGQYKPVPESCGLKIEKTIEKKNGLDEIRLKLCNTGKEKLLLRLRLKAENLQPGGNYWDGFEFHAQAKETVAPTGDRHVFPLTGYLYKGKLTALGFTPETCASRFERSFTVDSKGCGTLNFDLFWALLPGEKLDTNFVALEMNAKSYVEAVEKYHCTYPEYFRPVEGIDPRAYGVGGYLSSIEPLRDYQFEECRRTGFDWEWYYNCYQKAGDFFPKEAYWDSKIGYKTENSHAVCNAPGSIKDWFDYNLRRIRTGDKTTALFYYYMQEYCNTDLLYKVFPDSVWRDENGKPGYKVKGWADEFFAEYAWPGEKGSFGPAVRKDLAKLWESFPIAGFSLDCAIGSTRYYGPLVEQEKMRAFDDNGKLFVTEGVALAYNMDYTRKLPPHKDGRRAGSIINAPYTYLPIFHADGVMHEASAYERTDLPVPHRLMLGQKFWILWRGFVLEPFLDWPNISRDAVNESVTGAVDYLVLFTLRMGASPSMMFMRGYPDMLALRDLFTENAKMGWRAAPYAWVDGVEGAENPWDLKAKVWVSRYGDGDKSRIVLGIPTREGRRGKLRIETAKFGASGALYADLSGKNTVNEISDTETVVDFDIAGRDYIVLEKIGKSLGRVNAKMPDKQEEIALSPADGLWIPGIPFDDGKKSLAEIEVRNDELAGLEPWATALSTYNAYYRTRLNNYVPRLWGLKGRMLDDFRFPVKENASAKTVFALGKSARSKYFPGVSVSDTVVYREDNGRHYIGFFPGRKSEKDILKDFLGKLDRFYPFGGGMMSDWGAKVGSYGKAFLRRQPTFDDGVIHPAHVARHALNSDEVAVGRAADGKLYVRMRCSGNSDLVTELKTGLNGQLEFGSSHLIDSGLGVTVNSLPLPREMVYYAADEAAPILCNYGYVGGNHGLLVALTVRSPGHGLSDKDLGTEFLAGTRKYYPVKILNPDEFIVVSENIGRSNIGEFDRSSLKKELVRADHVYPAEKITHTQLYPAVRIKEQKFLLDGKELPISGEFIRIGHKLIVNEVYELLSPVSLMADILKHPGQVVDWRNPAVKPAYELTNTYEFTPSGTMLLRQKYRFFERVALRQIGILQSQPLAMTPGKQVREYLIPKTRPFAIKDKTFDFASGTDFSKPLPEVEFKNERLENPGNPPERFIQLVGTRNAKTGKTIWNAGLVIGYSLENGLTRPETRSKGVSRPMWIFRTQKSYPAALDAKFKAVLEPGTVLEFTGYRKIFQPAAFSETAPASYVIEDGAQRYWYCHFASAGEVEIPEAFRKTGVTVIEKSADVTVSRDKAISTSASGYVVLRQSGGI